MLTVNPTLSHTKWRMSRWLVPAALRLPTYAHFTTNKTKAENEAPHAHSDPIAHENSTPPLTTLTAQAPTPGVCRRPAPPRHQQCRRFRRRLAARLMAATPLPRPRFARPSATAAARWRRRGHASAAPVVARPRALRAPPPRGSALPPRPARPPTPTSQLWWWRRRGDGRPQ